MANVRLDDALYDELRKRAEASDRSLSAELRIAVRSHLGMLPKELPIDVPAVPVPKAKAVDDPHNADVCLHPVGRRIGVTCLACGKTVSRAG